MHDISVTEGIVLGKRLAGEATTRVAVLTREFGVIRVGARSARLERSKLRYGLETLTSGRFAMVRGKYEWKLTGAHDLSRVFAQGSLARRRSAGRIARLLLRLIHGEEPVVQIYETVKNGLSYMANAETDADIEQIECILVLRILLLLGYVDEAQSVKPFVSDTQFSAELAEQARAARTVLIRTINESLGATGL